jgi:hypothetical protein
MDLDAAPEGGARYPVIASLAGRVFTKFHLDVGIGDAVIQPTELLEGSNWLGFAGIEPPKFVAISKEQQLRKSCTPTLSHALREPTVASRMSSTWRFCFGSVH